MPQVSIIIINYNTFALTCGCIKSIYETVRNVDFEIILVDNASSECDPERFKIQFPGIKLVKNVINAGFAAGNNIGIKHAEGDIILLLNSDTIFFEDPVSACYTRLISQKKIAALTCKLLSPDSGLQYNCQPFPSLFKTLVQKLRIHKLFSSSFRSSFLQGSYWDYSRPGTPDWIWGTFFMLRKEVLNQLPGGQLNEDFFMYQEDMQWCHDFRKLGYGVAYVSEVAITHYVGGSAKKRSALIQKNYNLFLKKNYSFLEYLFLKH